MATPSKPALLTFLFCASLVALSSSRGAEVDISHHRAVYAEVNKLEGSYRKAKAEYKDDPLVFDLQGWFDGSTLRKIVAVSGEDGGGHEEIYLENGQPLFVYNTYHQGKKQVENRFYFRDGKLIHWLGEDKKPMDAGSAEFKSEAERLISNTQHFVAAFKAKTEAKGK